jgi:hypothetical protein
MKRQRHSSLVSEIRAGFKPRHLEWLMDSAPGFVLSRLAVLDSPHGIAIRGVLAYIFPCFLKHDFNHIQ